MDNTAFMLKLFCDMCSEPVSSIIQQRSKEKSAKGEVVDIQSHIDEALKIENINRLRADAEARGAKLIVRVSREYALTWNNFTQRPQDHLPVPDPDEDDIPDDEIYWETTEDDGDDGDDEGDSDFTDSDPPESGCSSGGEDSSEGEDPSDSDSSGDEDSSDNEDPEHNGVSSDRNSSDNQDRADSEDCWVTTDFSEGEGSWVTTDFSEGEDEGEGEGEGENRCFELGWVGRYADNEEDHRKHSGKEITEYNKNGEQSDAYDGDIEGSSDCNCYDSDEGEVSIDDEYPGLVDEDDDGELDLCELYWKMEYIRRCYRPGDSL